MHTSFLYGFIISFSISFCFIIAESSDLEQNETDMTSDWAEYLLNSESYKTKDDVKNKAHASLHPTDDKNDNFTLAFVLPQLIYQLLKNCSQQSLTALKNIGSFVDQPPQHTTDPGIYLLLTYQRLLLIRMFSEKELVNPSASRLMTKYGLTT